MGALDNITMEELHDVREQTDRKLPRERVLAAIGRKQGDGVKTLAERHGVAENTIRNWLDRFEEEMVEQAPYDELCPGPPETRRQSMRTAVRTATAHQPNSATSNKHGRQRFCSTSSKRSTVLSTVRDTLVNS